MMSTISLTGSFVPNICSVSEELLASNSCPSSEWQIIQTWLRLTNSTHFDGYGGLGPAAVEVSRKASLRQLQIATLGSGNPLLGNNRVNLLPLASSIATTQQAVIADALTLTGNVWQDAIVTARSKEWHGVSPSHFQSAVHTIDHNYYQPYLLGPGKWQFR